MGRNLGNAIGHFLLGTMCLAYILHASEFVSDPNAVDFTMRPSDHTIPVGQDVEIHLTLQNKSYRTIYLDQWQQLSGGDKPRSFSVTFEGRRLIYSGFIACGDRTIHRLRPNEKITIKYPVSKHFDLSRPGKYTIRAMYFSIGFPTWRGKIHATPIEFEVVKK